MNKKRVFISSVQSEFEQERQMLFEYFTSDALLGKFFEPFIFENVPAANYSPAAVFLNEVEQCDIYLGIFGEEYGYEDVEGISPTEREYDLAAQLHKTKLIFLKNTTLRHEKERKLIQKAEKEVIRKAFSNADELKMKFYASLVRYLEEKEILRLLPFDATFNRQATIDDIDEKKVKEFVRVARIKRAFPFEEEADFKRVLAQLNLIDSSYRITNAALLLFGKDPQKFMLTSTVKCCQFYGTKNEKPIPSYHIYYGDVFQLIDQVVSFVMSRIDAKVVPRDKNVSVDVDFELPREAVKESIVNAICHRDYTSNASVQVMLFRDRLEIWNPRHLPFGLTVEMLRGRHKSIPTNPLLAHPMYLFGSIEQMGTGTEMMIEKCINFGLREPAFQQDFDFITTFWRNEDNDTEGGQIGGAIGGAIESVLTERQAEILKVIEDNPSISYRNLSKQLNINKSATLKHLESLKNKGIIERVGGTRGYWKVIKGIDMTNHSIVDINKVR